MVYFIIWYLTGIVSAVYLIKTEEGIVKVKHIFLILPFALSGIIISGIVLYHKNKNVLDKLLDKDIF